MLPKGPSLTPAERYRDSTHLPAHTKAADCPHIIPGITGV